MKNRLDGAFSPLSLKFAAFAKAIHALFKNAGAGSAFGSLYDAFEGNGHDRNVMPLIAALNWTVLLQRACDWSGRANGKSRLDVLFDVYVQSEKERARNDEVPVACKHLLEMADSTSTRVQCQRPLTSQLSASALPSPCSRVKSLQVGREREKEENNVAPNSTMKNDQQ